MPNLALIIPAVTQSRRAESEAKSAWMPIFCPASLTTTSSPFIWTKFSMELIWMQSPLHYLAKQAARGLRLRAFNWSCPWMAALDLKGLVLAVSSLLTACVPGIWPCHFGAPFLLLCPVIFLPVRMTIPFSLPFCLFHVKQQIQRLRIGVTAVDDCLLILLLINSKLCFLSDLNNVSESVFTPLLKEDKGREYDIIRSAVPQHLQSGYFQYIIPHLLC